MRPRSGGEGRRLLSAARTVRDGFDDRLRHAALLVGVPFAAATTGREREREQPQGSPELSGGERRAELPQRRRERKEGVPVRDG